MCAGRALKWRDIYSITSAINAAAPRDVMMPLQRSGMTLARRSQSLRVEDSRAS